jgi:biopolymer transport protein ExbD
MIARRHRRRRQIEGADLELTAFINPMVVLVTFLLINVVFTHSAVLDLKLPAPSAGGTASPAKLQLEVTLRKDEVDLADRDRGLLARVPNTADGPDLAQLSDQIQKIKAQYPDVRDASVLVEPDIAYDRIVQVMDVVRSYESRIGGQRVINPLFPDIAIGDAPAAK